MTSRSTVSPQTYRRFTAAALVALAIIIVSGAAVRLTGSGLGCSDWPNCTEGRLVADLEYHALIEFVNRVFTGVVSIAVALAVAGSLRRNPYRRDLVLWSLGLVAGVIGQIILGAFVVKLHLIPGVVIGHFLLSLVLVTNAVILHHRAGLATSSDGEAIIGPILVPEPLRRLATFVVIGATVVVLTGTIVTGSGPHGGDEDAERLPFLFNHAARVHGIAVMIFLAITIACALAMVRAGAAARITRSLSQLLVVIVAQGAIGYVQYFTEVPALLVGFHVLGATLLWIATMRFALNIREPAIGVSPDQPVGLRQRAGTNR